MRFLAEFRIAADFGEVPELRRALRQRLEPIGLQRVELDRLVLVVDEIVNNAIEHGTDYRAQDDELSLRVLVHRTGRVDVEFRDPSVPKEIVDEIRCQLVAHDNGRAAPPVHGERGRGLFLIADAFDGMSVEHGERGRGLVFRGRIRRGDA